MAGQESHGHSPAWYAWQRFKRNHTAWFSFWFIILCALIALSGYLFLPDPTPNANRQQLELETLPPGSKVDLLRIINNTPPAQTGFLDRIISGSPQDYTERPFKSYQIKGDSIVLVPRDALPGETETYHLADVIYAVSPDSPAIRLTGDRISFIDYKGVRREKSLSELQTIVKEEHIIHRRYWLGTDRYGRDLLSRLLLGTRVSLSVGLISVMISLLIGLTLGALAGFYRGWVDSVILWLVNVVWSIPTFLLVMAVSLVLGKGFWQVFVAVGLTMWVEVARLVRGQLLSVRELEYVQAARALGFRNSRIIVRHILPNITGPVLVISAANFASAILLEAGLSFLGLGVQPPAPSWGTMIAEHYGFIVMDAAWLAVLPGLAIMLLVLAFNLLGNGLRDALDVRLRA